MATKKQMEYAKKNAANMPKELVEAMSEAISESDVEFAELDAILAVRAAEGKTQAERTKLAIEDYANRADTGEGEARRDILESELGEEIMAEYDISVDDVTEYNAERQAEIDSRMVVGNGLNQLPFDPISEPVADANLDEVEVEDIIVELSDGSEIFVPATWEEMSKSARCRVLYGQGATVNQISKALGIRYQQVRQACLYVPASERKALEQAAIELLSE